MGYPTKVQRIKRKDSEQWYISFPSAVARAMEFSPSETVEWIIEDKGQLVLKRMDVPPSALKKKTPAGLLEHLEALWGETRQAFRQKRTWRRAKALSLSALVCLGRRTLTGLLMTSVRQFEDWTADFRLFSGQRFDENQLFATLRRAVLSELSEETPFVVAMDDTLFRKTGVKTHGVAWRRDPLGPPFQTNFIRGQRFLQISAALPEAAEPCAARMIPVDLRHCPTPRKPRKSASEEEWKAYRKAQNRTKISRRGAEQLRALRESLDREPGGAKRHLVAGVDGSFTNATVLKNIPERTTLIGRIRKDAKLYHLPQVDASPGRGRKRAYGRRAPTPEALRKDPDIPWQPVRAWAAGKLHDFKIKTISPLRWRTAGGQHNLRLVVIAPLAYRLTKNSRALYRKPAYLICTDAGLPLEKLLQYYLWRWGIEVNFREEKTLLGTGQSQVRHPQSVEKVPILQVVSYAMLLIASRKAFRGAPNAADTLPQPKWRKERTNRTTTTGQIVNHLRAELWGKALGIGNFSGFAKQVHSCTKPQKLHPQLPSAVLYAYG